MILLNKEDEQLTFNYFKTWTPYPASTAYLVHRFGYVKNAKSSQLLKPITLKSGYQQLTLAGRKLYVHQIVARSFIREYSTMYEIDHIDGNRANNKIDNLEIVTHQINCERRGKPSAVL
jgi:hypothetical protein